MLRSLGASVRAAPGRHGENFADERNQSVAGRSMIGRDSLLDGSPLATDWQEI